MLYALILFILVTPAATAQGVTSAVPQFELPRDGIAFKNYAFFEESELPRWAQVPHCTGLALMVRQIHYYAIFRPDLPEVSQPELEHTLETIYWQSTTQAPEARVRFEIPHYTDLYALTASRAGAMAVKRVLHDAIFDALRPGWNWLPPDVLHVNADTNRAVAASLMHTVDRGRLAMLYLTRGTARAHAVMVHAYRAVPGKIVFSTYDSRRNTGPMEITYSSNTGQFYHPHKGGRDGWILHPYRDEAEVPGMPTAWWHP